MLIFAFNKLKKVDGEIKWAGVEKERGVGVALRLRVKRMESEVDVIYKDT